MNTDIHDMQQFFWACQDHIELNTCSKVEDEEGQEYIVYVSQDTDMHDMEHFFWTIQDHIEPNTCAKVVDEKGQEYIVYVSQDFDEY